MCRENKAVVVSMDSLEQYCNQSIKTIVVHGGVFHADDVFCVALMKLVFPSIDVVRAFNVNEYLLDDSVIIADIGGGKYDHHQADAALRPDGNKHAACGLIYRDYGQYLFPDVESYESFKEKYIIPIEDQDNGVEKNPLSMAIKAMNPTWDNSDERYTAACFDMAVNFALRVIEAERKQAYANNLAKEAADNAINNSKDGIVVLERYLPSYLFTGKVNLLISPSLRGGYQLLTVKKEADSMENMVDLPEDWLTNKPIGCTFVHQAKFIASFDTLENAVAAANNIQ